VSRRELAEAVDQTWDVDKDQQRQILRQLSRMGDLISQLASARSQLHNPLDDRAVLGGAISPQGED